MKGINTRPIVFAFYLTSTGMYNSMPMYTDVAAVSALANQNVSNGGSVNTTTEVKGSTLGVDLFSLSKVTVGKLGVWATEVVRQGQL